MTSWHLMSLLGPGVVKQHSSQLYWVAAAETCRNIGGIRAYHITYQS